MQGWNVWAIGPAGFGAYRFESGQLSPTQEKPTHILSPGFVDVHIHGAFGIDFMSASVDQMVKLSNQLVEIGYEGWLPTTVTASPEQVRSAIDALPDHPSILGFHLEGPFISPKFPGAQPPNYILDPTLDDPAWNTILSDPRLKLITLAPERPGALELTKRLTERGVVVSFGHTDATYAEANSGFEHGARHATHTFNAMRPFHHREAGTVGFVLAEHHMNAELIYDRHHVSKDSARLLVNLKMPDHLVAVSDSTMASGMGSGTELEMWGLACVVQEGTIRLKSNGALAGSAITLKDAFQNLAEDFGPEVALRAACYNPRLVLGLKSAPKVLLLWNQELDLVDRIGTIG